MGLISSDAALDVAEHQQVLSTKQNAYKVNSAFFSLQHADVRWPAPSNGKRIFAHAALASLVAIVMLISLCSIVQREKKRSAFLMHRKLSAEDDGRPEGLMHCREVDEEEEAETPPSNPEATAPPPSETEEHGPGAKRPRLEEPQPEPGTSSTSSLPASGEPFPALERLSPLEGRSSAEIAAASALLELNPRPSGIVCPGLERGPERQAEEEPSDPGEGPSGVSAVGAIGASPPSASALHPGHHQFAHLPRLRAGVSIRRFNAQHASIPEATRELPIYLLRDMLDLLSQESLNAQEAEMLLILIEESFAHCIFYQRAEVSLSRPNRAVEVLGVRYLLLEAIISGLKVLGQSAPPALWEQLANAMPHQCVSTTGGATAYKQKARMLSEAIEKMKTGERPKDEEIVQMKMLIFCSEPIPERFKAASFAPWRDLC